MEGVIKPFLRLIHCAARVRAPLRAPRRLSGQSFFYPPAPENHYRCQNRGDDCVDPAWILDGMQETIGKYRNYQNSGQHADCRTDQVIFEPDVGGARYHINNRKGRHRNVSNNGNRQNPLFGHLAAQAIQTLPGQFADGLLSQPRTD